MMDPDGCHESPCSKPLVGSLVLDRAATRENTRRILRFASSCAERGSKLETAKKAESPRQEIRGSPSSSGELWGVVEVGVEVDAADLPTEPRNCVDLSPQPTLTGASAEE